MKKNINEVNINFPADRSDLIEKACKDEDGCVSVGGLEREIKYRLDDDLSIIRGFKWGLIITIVAVCVFMIYSISLADTSFLFWILITIATVLFLTGLVIIFRAENKYKNKS